MPSSIDTHQYVKQFMEAGVPEKQAEVTVSMFSEVLESREQIYKNQLASKQDLLNTQNLLQKEMRDNNVSMIKWFAGMMIAQAGVIVALIKVL